jgi:hypothetical protein
LDLARALKRIPISHLTVLVVAIESMGRVIPLKATVAEVDLHRDIRAA